VILYYHPLSSFCHKALIALYEKGVEFERRVIDLGNPESRAELVAVWPMAKFPVLCDGDKVLPESSILIEHLGGLIPSLETRLWDRIFDNYVMVPMAKIVADTFKPPDPAGVEEAHATLERVYPVLEKQLEGKAWAVGEDFTMADCAAAPALFYADIVHPFSPTGPLRAYYERLLERPSVARVLEEARPYFAMFPLKERIPARFT